MPGVGLSRRRVGRGQVPPGDVATLQGMHPIALLGPLSDLHHAPDQGFSDSPEALEYKGSSAVVRFDKATAAVTLDPLGADVLALLQELQALATAQHDDDKARLLARLRLRRLSKKTPSDSNARP